jgi:hypothetical protein
LVMPQGARELSCAASQSARQRRSTSPRSLSWTTSPALASDGQAAWLARGGARLCCRPG